MQISAFIGENSPMSLHVKVQVNVKVILQGSRSFSKVVGYSVTGGEIPSPVSSFYNYSFN